MANKTLFLLGFLTLMGFIGYKVGRPGDKKTFTIAGVFVGFLIFSGVSSWVFPKPAESSYDPNILIPGSGESSYVAGKCWTCGAAEARAGRCTPCKTNLSTGSAAAV